MADLEKVIKGLELCLGSIDSAGCPEGCPYYEACQKYENYAVFQPLMRDALEALKEQWPIIHCKDCKYAKPLNEEYLGCSCLVDGIDSDYVMTVKPDSYCSWADRR